MILVGSFLRPRGHASEAIGETTDSPMSEEALAAEVSSLEPSALGSVGVPLSPRRSQTSPQPETAITYEPPRANERAEGD